MQRTLVRQKPGTLIVNQRLLKDIDPCKDGRESKPLPRGADPVFFKCELAVHPKTNGAKDRRHSADQPSGLL